jgi:hypothetical protein
MSAAQLDWKPVTRPDELEPLFRQLARQWQDETRYYSFAPQYAVHPAYLRIIGLGPAVLPLLLDELRQRSGHWFPALEAITGVNPVPPEARGNVPQMIAAWVEWGRRHGLIAEAG